MTIILKLKNCGTNRVTHEVFAECGKIHGMRDNHAKCVTGGNPMHILSDGLSDPHISLASFKKQLKTSLFKNGDVLLHPSK